MKEFLEVSMQLPTVIPFFMTILMLCFFILSLLTGFGKDISIDGDSDVNTDGIAKPFLAILGLKSGVHTMLLLLFSSFVLFSITFLSALCINFNENIVNKIIGVVLVFGLFPICNRVVYMLLKPISNMLAKSEKNLETLIGKTGVVRKLSSKGDRVFMVFDDTDIDQMIVSMEKESVGKIKEADRIFISRKELDEGNNTIYIIDLIK